MSSELWTLALVLLAPVAIRKAVQLTTASSSHKQKASRGSHSTSLRASAFSSPFQLVILFVTLTIVLVSVRNLVPVRFGVELVVPEQVIATLQRTFYTLYTSPTPTPVEPLHLSLRGGYHSDIFLTLKAPITIPTATLRSLLASAPSLLDLGFAGSEGDLQSLIGRLSSYDGRKLYLLVGAAPLTDCVFCHAGRDYLYFALPGLARQYAWRIMAVGLLTASPSDPIALLIKRIGRLLQLRPLSVQQPSAITQELDRKQWRGYAISALLAMMTVEAGIMSELGEVRAGQGRWNHWSANLHILRQLLFAAISLVVYLRPSHPQPSPFERIVATMRATHAKLEKATASIEAGSISRQIVWRDEGLVRKVADWHVRQAREDAAPDCDAMVAFARKVGIDVAGVANTCSTAAQVTLHDAELYNYELDKVAAAAQLGQSEQRPSAGASKESNGGLVADSAERKGLGAEDASGNGFCSCGKLFCADRVSKPDSTKTSSGTFCATPGGRPALCTLSPSHYSSPLCADRTDYL